MAQMAQTMKSKNNSNKQHMTRSDWSGSSAGIGFALWTAMLLAALAPLFRGGNRWVPLALLEWLALALLLWLTWQTNNGRLDWRELGRGWRRWALLALLASPMVMAVAQLLPLPGDAGWVPLSRVPDATWGSALAALPVLATMLVALVLPSRALATLAYCWMLVAITQAMLGIAQLSGWEALYFDRGVSPRSIGTFGNPNHFASFLLMSVPLFVWAIRRSRSRRSGADGKAFWLWLLGLFLVFMALLASLSRAGQSLGALLAVASAWLFWRPQARAQAGGWRSWAWTGAPLLLLLALAVGGLDWLSRFDAAELASSAAVRAQNRNAAFEAALAYLPWGAGLGSFASVFPPFQPVSIPQWVDHAHNDYAQWLVEGGLMALLVMGLAVALGVRRLLDLARSDDKAPGRHRSGDDAPDARLVLACGLGLAGVLLHAWVDFPMRIPANAMLAGFLAGVFLRVPTDQSKPEQP